MTDVTKDKQKRPKRVNDKAMKDWKDAKKSDPKTPRPVAADCQSR